MTQSDFSQRLAALGVPAEIIPGFAPGGAFRAFFEAPDEAHILAFFARDPQSDDAPGPYFDPAYYRAQNPDWRSAGSALGHFLLCLIRGETRPAHPLFDADCYGAHYEDLRAAKSANLLHFAQFGDAEGRRPSAQFDPVFYAARYLSLAETRPFAHYLTTGRNRGRLPCPRQIAPGETKKRIMAQLDQAARPVLLMGHDARKAGAQIRLLALGQALRARGWNPIFVLGDGGPLVPRFETVGPVTVLCEGWILDELSGVAPEVPLISVTVETAHMVAQICEGRRSFIMILEMPAYWRARGLTPALDHAARAGVQMIFGFPAIAEGYAEDIPPNAAHAPTHLIMPALCPATETCADYLYHARRKRNRPGPVIIGAGFADHRKGFDWFVAVALRLRDTIPQVRFIWLGELSAWAHHIAQDALAQGLDLEIPGFVDDSNAWYAAADLFLLTTREDPGPTVLADAVAQGAPYVGFKTDLGMLGLMAQYPETGALVAAGDIAAAADAVIEQLSQDTRTKRRVRRRIVAQLNDYPRYVSELDALLSAG